MTIPRTLEPQTLTRRLRVQELPRGDHTFSLKRFRDVGYKVVGLKVSYEGLSKPLVTCSAVRQPKFEALHHNVGPKPDRQRA